MQNSLRLSVIAVLLSVSCVYTFSGGFPSKYRSVYIAPFENSTRRQDITLEVQNYFIEGIQKDGRLNVVSKNRAKMEIIPVLMDFNKRASEFTETGEVTVYTISIKAKILTETLKDSLLYLQDSIFYGRGVYSVLSEDENTGIKRAVTDLVNNFLNRLFEAKI